MEFMEGDTPQSMFALWWKEWCTSSACAPEKTCAGTSGEPILSEQRSVYYTNTDYTFDNQGCYYKHTTNAAVNQYCVTSSCSIRTDKMVKIRRLWQFPSYSPVNPLPSDVYNREQQVIYTSSDSVANTNHGWMLADVVPMNSCAYVVSQTTTVSGSNVIVNYNFEQWVMSVQADATLQ